MQRPVYCEHMDRDKNQRQHTLTHIYKHTYVSIDLW